MTAQKKSHIESNEVNSGVLQVFSNLQAPDQTGLPKYRRLEQAILECIRKGYWKPGDKLPAEEQLTELVPFSLGTVQHAMRQLAEDGVVDRQHGTGSYVQSSMKLLSEPWHCRFRDQGTGEILPILSQTVQRKEAGDGPWQDNFLPNTRLIRLDRIVSVNDEFLVFSRFYFDANVVKVLNKKPLKSLDGASFRRMIAETSSLPITEVQRHVSFCDFDKETRQMLGEEGGTQGMCLEAIGRSGRRRAIFYHQFMIPKTHRPLVMPTDDNS